MLLIQFNCNYTVIDKANSTRFLLSGVEHIRPDRQGSCRVCTTGNEENNGIYTTDCLAILKEVG